MKLLFLDTETTGLDFERSAIIQIGVILDNFDKKTSDRVNIKIRPHEGTLIEQKRKDHHGGCGVMNVHCPSCGSEAVDGVESTTVLFECDDYGARWTV